MSVAFPFSTKLLIGAVFAILASMLCVAQTTSVECESQWTTSHCSNIGQISFYGNNFGTVESTYVLSDNPYIMLWVSASNGTCLSGKLEYDTAHVPDGPYAVKIPINAKNSTMWTVTVLLGNLHGLQYMVEKNYYSGVPPAGIEVLNQSTNVIFNGLTFIIDGKFNVSNKYSVFMYSTLMRYDEYFMPICKVKDLTETSLTCMIDKLSDKENLSWRFLVKDETVNNFVTMKAMLHDLTNINPSTKDPVPSTFPLITGADGECVQNSIYCTDGANITFYGSDFLSMHPNGYQINIEQIDKGKCVVQYTSDISLMCTLNGMNAKEGVFIMTLQIREENGNWSNQKTIVGTLLLGKKDGSSGWTISYIESDPDDNIISPLKAQSSTATTVLTIVFAIFFAITVIVMLIICMRYKLITRTVWCTIKKQLQETQVEELRPRAAVHVKGEPANEWKYRN